ncbi:retrotransposon protein, putative, ty1-copia subclass [Tanacetum coccineum]
MFVIEQPIPPAPPAHSTVQELKSMFEKQARVERFDLIQTFHAYKQEKGKPVSPYVIKIKGYVKQLEHLGYVLPQDLSVGLIMNGLTSDFAGFVRNYNMHNIEKTIGGRIQKANKKSLNAKGKGKGKGKGKDKPIYIPKPQNLKPSAKENPTKDDACHHCKEVGHRKRNCLAFIAELIKKKKQVGTARSSTKYNLDSTYMWHCCLAHIRKKRIEKLQYDGLLKSTDEESFEQCVSCLSGMMTRKLFLHRTERATDLLGLIHTDVCGPLRHVSREDRGGEYISQEFKDYLKACGIVQQLKPPYTPQQNGVSKKRNRTLLDMVRSMMNLTTLPLSFWDYALETATHILNMVPTKKVDKTPYELSGRVVELKEIQDKDTSPSENTSKIPIEVEGFEPPQEEVVPVRRSTRTHRALDRLCLNVEVKEHTLENLNCHTPKRGLDEMSVRGRDIIIYITQDQWNDH